MKKSTRTHLYILAERVISGLLAFGLFYAIAKFFENAMSSAVDFFIASIIVFVLIVFSMLFFHYVIIKKWETTKYNEYKYYCKYEKREESVQKENEEQL